MLISSERVAGKGEGRNHLSGDEVFLDDAFQNFRRTRVVPHAFGINDSDGAAHTDAEAVGLGAEDQRLRTGQAKFLQPPLQEFPGRNPGFPGAAFGFGRFGAQKDVTLEVFQAQFGGGGLEVVGHKVAGAVSGGRG